MGLDKDILSTVRGLSEPELRRLVILAQDLLERRERSEVAGAKAGRVPGGAKVTYRLEEVRCGKTHCTRCPHGPYWYAYWREDGRVRSRYLGSAREPGPARTASGSDQE